MEAKINLFVRNIIRLYFNYLKKISVHIDCKAGILKDNLHYLNKTSTTSKHQKYNNKKHVIII